VKIPGVNWMDFNFSTLFLSHEYVLIYASAHIFMDEAMGAVMLDLHAPDLKIL
jgi:hypothetical protein